MIARDPRPAPLCPINDGRNKSGEMRCSINLNKLREELDLEMDSGRGWTDSLLVCQRENERGESAISFIFEGSIKFVGNLEKILFVESHSNGFLLLFNETF